MKSAALPQRYVVLVPNLDDSGPVNVALDLAGEATKYFRSVEVRYLKKTARLKEVPLGVAISKLKLVDLVSRENTIFHSHTIQVDLINFLISKINSNAVCVSTLHNFFLEDIKFLKGPALSQISWLFWAFCARRLHAAIAISTPMQTYYSNRNFRNTHLIYNTRKSPPDTISPQCKKYRDRGKVNLLFAGGLNNRKNVLGLIKNLDYSKYTIFVAGDGPLKSEVVSAAEHNNSIRYLGFKDKLDDILPCVDALVLPSHSEGFPLVCLEAMSHGIPCLLSDIPVHHELEELGFGVVFDHRTFSNFPSAAKQVLSKDFSREVLKSRFRRHFSSVSGFSQYINLLSEVSGKVLSKRAQDANK